MIREFLTAYLPRQKTVSPNTVKFYKNTLNLFLDYSKEKIGVSSAKLGFQHITREHVENFIYWLEEKCCYRVTSHNQRLAELKDFYRHSAEKDAALTNYYQELLNISVKKQNRRHEIGF